jgi:hypothetical protein
MGASKVSKSRRNRNRPSGRTRGSDRAPPGKVPTGRPSIGISENRGLREQRNLAAWNRDPRYPDKIRTFYRGGYVSGDPGSRESGNQSFRAQRNLGSVGHSGGQVSCTFPY